MTAAESKAPLVPGPGMPAPGVRLQKWMLLAVIIGLVYILRHLLPVIFLTFILAYIGNTIVSAMTRRFPHRIANLVILWLVLITVLVLGIWAIVPRLFGEARDLAQTYLEEGEGDTGVVARVPRVAGIDEGHDRRDRSRHVPPAATAVTDTAAAPGTDSGAVTETTTVITRTTRKYIDIAIAQVMGREALARFQQSPTYHDLIVRAETGVRDFIPKIVAGVTEFLNKLLVVIFHFILSLIFSFVILWRLPELTEGARSFSSGRTAGVYAALAPGFRAFAHTLGRAFEAQTGIAIVNSVLTAVGFLLLGIPSIALLSTIVFFCSYIPVLGVILSTLPAALLAFKVGGFITVLWLVVMILLVHAIEAYGLNPLIYGHHLRIEPIAVLVILLVGEHLFGAWGLLLGVPVSAFILNHIIRGEGAA